MDQSNGHPVEQRDEQNPPLPERDTSRPASAPNLDEKGPPRRGHRAVRSRASDHSSDGRPANPGNAGTFAERVVSDALRRRLTPPDDPIVQELCPDLWDLLTREKYTSGKDRLPADIVIERIEGGYTVTIKDHDSGTAWAFTLDRLENLAVASETALHDPKTRRTTFKSFKNKKGLDKFREKKA
jgi:hypothetical protein